MIKKSCVFAELQWLVFRIDIRVEDDEVLLINHTFISPYYIRTIIIVV